MPIELQMPALSPTMEKGTLAKWLVSVGDAVRPGDVLAEIETDKATMEFEAADEGRILSILFPAGTEDLPVGTTIALLGAQDDSVVVAQPPAVPEQPAASPAPAPVAAVPVVALADAPVAVARRSQADGLNVSPLARRIAEAANIDLNGIAGSGPDGRILRADLGLHNAARAQPAPREPAMLRASAAAPFAAEPLLSPPPEGVPHDVVKLSSMRRTVARRLTEAKQSVPHFYLSVHCVLDELLRLRSDLNANLAPRGVKLSVNDFLLKAMAAAMLRVPEVNVQFAGDEYYQFRRVDLSMAVAIDGGLITPVIQDVANLSLSGIAERSQALAARAREGRLTPADYQGGTATLSNLGMFGIDDMVPVINPPQALILGAAASRRMPWNVDGSIALATVLTTTASFDHRVIDGAIGARFMSAFRDAIEAPMNIIC